MIHVFVPVAMHRLKRVDGFNVGCHTNLFQYDIVSFGAPSLALQVLREGDNELVGADVLDRLHLKELQMLDMLWLDAYIIFLLYGFETLDLNY